MEIEIVTFGKIAEFIKHQHLVLSEVENTEQLKTFLEQQFPQLGAMKYKLAVNQAIVHDHVLIRHGDSVALMPPFSGG